MNSRSASDWPLLSIQLPPDGDDEHIAQLTQAAAELGALGGASEGGCLKIYLPHGAKEPEIRAIIKTIQFEAQELGWDTLECQTESLLDAPWATAWKKDFVSLPIGKKLLIRPDWESGQPALEPLDHRLTIWIRPGFGFGTGRHETTQLALEFLEKYLPLGSRVLDFGAGNGILGIAAVKLGASLVAAVEFDPDANENARENMALNRCDGLIRIYEANRPDNLDGTFDLIVCNMLPHEALPHFSALAARLENRYSALIYSGFLADQKCDTRKALEMNELIMKDYVQINEWGAFVAKPAK